MMKTNKSILLFIFNNYYSIFDLFPDITSQCKNVVVVGVVVVGVVMAVVVEVEVIEGVVVLGVVVVVVGVVVVDL